MNSSFGIKMPAAVTLQNPRITFFPLNNQAPSVPLHFRHGERRGDNLYSRLTKADRSLAGGSRRDAGLSE